MQAGGGAVAIEINVAARNRRGAQLSAALALFVIVELAVFISVLNRTAVDLLVKPVAGILHVIRTQAQRVMAAFDKDEVRACLRALCGMLCTMLCHEGVACRMVWRTPSVKKEGRNNNICSSD